MKKLMNRGIVALLGIVFVVASCGKYDDGPGLTLLTKKMRLTGTWDATRIDYASGNSLTIDPNTVTLTFQKDGTYSGSYAGFGETGTWEFNSDKTKITTTVNGNSNTTDAIDRLSNKELWFKNTSGDIYKYSKK